jgi:hypothetical protein
MLRGSSFHLPASSFEKELLLIQRLNMVNKPPLLPRRREPNSVRYEKNRIGSPPSRGRGILKVTFSLYLIAESISRLLKVAEAEDNSRATPASPFEKGGLRGITAVETHASFRRIFYTIISTARSQNWTPAYAGATDLSKLGRI